MAWRRGRVVPGNTTYRRAIMYVPDAWSVSLASSMALATETSGPMSVGTSPLGRGQYTGDPGYGVNRFAGLTAPLQQWVGLIMPIEDPSQRAVGIGSGVSGQPGMPQTGLFDGTLGPGPGPGMGT